MTPAIQRWNPVAQGLHWLMVVLIVANVVIGLVAEDMRLSPDKLKLFIWHKSLGLTVLALALIRLVWRWTHKVPEIPPALPRWERLAAHAAHIGLYGMMIVMPLSGWILNSASNVPLRWFWLFKVPDLVSPNEDWKAPLTALHEWLFYAFAALVLVHAAAALKHHFIDRNEVLIRMWPFSK